MGLTKLTLEVAIQHETIFSKGSPRVSLVPGVGLEPTLSLRKKGF